jgi:hypothetical protein
MTKILEITASTTDAEIAAAIPFIDMQRHAIERRDDALAVQEEWGDLPVLDLFEFDNQVFVLFDAIVGYGFVNQQSTGVGDSLLVNDQVHSEIDVLKAWVDPIN